MEAVGLCITALAGLTISAIGVLYLVRPRMVAVALLLAAESSVIGWVLLCFTLIPVGDAATVLGSRGRSLAAWGIHGTTALVMLVGATLLLVAP